MRRSIVRLEEMRKRMRRDAELDMLIEHPVGSTTDPFERFASDLHRAFPEETPSAALWQQHVVAILSRVAETSPRSKIDSARRVLQRPLLLAARITGGAAFLTGALTAAAYADVLPPEVHAVVANVTSIFGIEIPDKDENSGSKSPAEEDPGAGHSDDGEQNNEGDAPAGDGDNADDTGKSDDPDGPGSGDDDDPGSGDDDDPDDPGSGNDDDPDQGTDDDEGSSEHGGDSDGTDKDPDEPKDPDDPDEPEQPDEPDVDSGEPDEPDVDDELQPEGD